LQTIENQFKTSLKPVENQKNKCNPENWFCGFPPGSKLVFSLKPVLNQFETSLELVLNQV